jgi:hypothetical protein
LKRKEKRKKKKSLICLLGGFAGSADSLNGA